MNIKPLVVLACRQVAPHLDASVYDERTPVQCMRLALEAADPKLRLDGKHDAYIEERFRLELADAQAVTRADAATVQRTTSPETLRVDAVLPLAAMRPHLASKSGQSGAHVYTERADGHVRASAPDPLAALRPNLANKGLDR